MANLPFHLSSQVSESLSAGKPILALESTVITHGLPYPENITTAQSLEQLARDNGVTPATIAIIEGIVHIGLDEGELTKLGELSRQQSSKSNTLKKIALKDIPLAFAQKWSGGTTVSATLFLAHKAGIKVFATGGIGGVHRAWQESMDISADLQALAKYPVIIVTAGCKAILDIPATLEHLESLSVPVYGWKTDKCPAFYTNTTNYQIDIVDDVKTIVNAYNSLMEFTGADNCTSIVIMNPIPAEHSIPSEQIEPYIEQSIKEAKQHGIKGKAITPWLLQRLAEVTLGKSIKANLELLKNNVLLGCLIAKELS